MFDLREAFKVLNELMDEADKPEIIKIEVIVQPVDITEGLPDPSSGKYDEQTLEDWYDFASTVEGIVDNFCDVVNISLSKNPDSLSEYIDFYVYDEEGNRKNYLIDLRLSDHGGTENARQVRKKHAKKIDNTFILRSIIVNNNTVKSYNEAVQKVRKLLADLSMKD